MAAPPTEADQLRQQIAFLTNLINTAHTPGGSNVHHARQQWSSQGQSNFSQVQNQLGHQPVLPRQPQAQSFSTSQARPISQYESRNARFPDSSSTTAFHNQTNNGAHLDGYNRPALLNTQRSAYNPNISPQNVPRPEYNSANNPTQNPARYTYNPSMPSQNSSSYAYSSSNPPQTSSRVVYKPPKNSTLSRTLPNSNVPTSNPGSLAPENIPNQGSSNPGSLAPENIPNQGSSAIGQNGNTYQSQRFQQQGSGCVTRSYPNVDVCVSGNQQEQQQYVQQPQQQVSNPRLAGQMDGNSVAEPSRIQSSDVAGPSPLQSNPAQQDEGKSDQLAKLMGELQKTQSKIMDLQKQLTPNPDVQAQPQAPLQSQAIVQQQGVQQQGLQQQGLQQQAPSQPQRPTQQQPGSFQHQRSFHPQVPLRQEGPPLQQHSALQQQRQLQQGPSLQQGLPLQQLQRSLQLRGPAQVPRLSGPGRSGPAANQAALLSALSAFVAQGQPLAKSERVWINPRVSHPQIVAQRSASSQVAGIVGRQVVGRPFTAGQAWPRLQPRQMSFFPRHPAVMAGHNLVKSFQRQVSPFDVNQRFQLKKLQSQVLANSLQLAAQARQLQQPFGHVSQGLAGSHMTSLGVQAQVASNKYQLQRAGTFPVAPSMVTKYKLQKYAGPVNYRSSTGTYVGQGSRFRPQYPFVPTFGYIQPNIWRSMRGSPFTRSAWSNYQQRVSPWISEHSERRKQAGTASRFWKKKHWLRWTENSRLEMKKLLQKRLLLLRKTVRPGSSKLKLDRRKKTPSVSSSVKRPVQRSDSRLVLINGMLYKSSSKNLTRAKILLEKTNQKPSTSATPSASGKASVVIKKLNRTAMKTLSVRGVKFRIDSTGKSLQRIDQGTSTSSRPRTEVRRVDIAGVTYIQTEPGTLVRTSSTRTRAAASRVKSWSIAAATHTLRKDNTKSVDGYCVFYNKFGRCKLGVKCPYKHDPAKVAVCTRFLRGTCKVDNCPFSHKVAKEKMPVCSFFLRGMCSRDDCPYLHVKVNKDADICHDFVRGYCPRGENCQKKHTLRCPAFAETGSCPRGKRCPMLHKRTAKKRPGHRPTSTAPAKKTEMQPDPENRVSGGAPAHTDTASSNSDGFWTDSVVLQTHSDTAPDAESETSPLKDVASPHGATSEHGDEKTAVDEISSAGDMVTGGVMTGDMATADDVTDVVTAGVDASDKAISSQDTKKATPEKLPTYISLADIPNIEEEVEGKSGNSDSALQIRPRLS